MNVGRLSQIMVERVAMTDLAGTEGVLLANAHSRPSRLLVVSPSAEEARVTGAVALATALAASRPTILVDADITGGGVTAAFGMETSPGLADVLLDGVVLDGAVVASDIPNLSVLGRGLSGRPSAQVLDGDKFPALLARLSRDWGYVVCDAPPLLTASETSMIARHFEAAMMVLTCDQTRWEVAQLATSRLEAAGGTLAGAILTNRQYPIPQAIYKAL